MLNIEKITLTVILLTIFLPFLSYAGTIELPAYSLTPYDDFSAPLIDPAKWQSGEFVQAIDTVNQSLISKTRAYGSRITNNLQFRDSDPITYIETDVVLNAAEGDFDLSDPNKYSMPNARITGFFYNDGTGSPGSYVGDVQACIRVYSIRGSLWAGWIVWKATSADGSTWATLAHNYFRVVTVTLDHAYKLSLKWDTSSKTFTFGIDGTSESYNVPDSTINPPNIPWKVIGTDAWVPAAPSYNAYVASTFDNVVAKDASSNILMSDDFSSAKIDETKWATYESLREVKDGKLRLKARSSQGSTSAVDNYLSFKIPQNVNVIQADVTPVAYVNEQGALTRARLVGRFYNDGTPGGGYLGDIMARVYFGGTGSSPKFFWSVARQTSITDWNPATNIASGEFTKSVVLGNTYRLLVGWDGATFTFKVDDEEATYTSTTAILPPNKPFKGLDTRIDSATGQEAVIEALYDNIMTDPSRLSLTTGWNFISFPKLPLNPDIAAVLADVSSNVRIVWGYDNQAKTWKKWNPSASSSTLTSIESGKGYWIYMDTSANFSVTGIDASPNIHLYEGWNLVGVPRTNITDVSTALSSISGKWNIIWGWGNGQWYGKHEVIPNLPAPIQPLSVLKQGKAYWIKIKPGQETNWTPPLLIDIPSVNPPIITAGQAADVTISAYIPNTNLTPISVSLLRVDSTGKTTTIGTLNDQGLNGDAKAGDQIFTITASFIESAGASITLRVSVVIEDTSGQITRDFQIPVVPVPTIQDYNQYNQTINDIFAKLLDTRNTFVLAKGTDVSPTQFFDYLAKNKDNLTSVYASLNAIYRFETHSPSNYPILLSYIPILGSLIVKQQQALNEIDNFVNYGNTDPSVSDIANWSVTYCLFDESALVGDAGKEMRKVCANQYEKYSKNSGFNNARREAAKVIVKEGVGQYTNLVGDGIGDIFEGTTGNIVAKGVNWGISKLLDVFLSKTTNEMGLLVGEVTDGESVQVPAGTHDVLVSSTTDNTRAIAQNILVATNTTTTINLNPGEVKAGVIVLASDLLLPTLLCLDGTHVYWTERGAVKKVSLNGGTPLTLTSSFPYPGDGTGIAVDGASIYWAATPGSGTGNIYKMPIEGGVITTLAFANQPYDIAVDVNSVYWAENNGGPSGSMAIRKVPINGGTVIPLTTDSTGAVMATDENYIYYFRYPDAGSKISKVNKNGGSVTDLASSVENIPMGIAVDSNYVYWSDVVGLVPGSITGSIKRVPINGGIVDTLASGLRDPKRIVIDNNYIYFTEYAMLQPSAGAIKKVSKNGGVVTTLVDGLTGPLGIAIDNNYIYWTELGPLNVVTSSYTNGSVKKISKQ